MVRICGCLFSQCSEAAMHLSRHPRDGLAARSIVHARRPLRSAISTISGTRNGTQGCENAARLSIALQIPACLYHVQKSRLRMDKRLDARCGRSEKGFQAAVTVSWSRRTTNGMKF
jgi:hypothetical protein